MAPRSGERRPSDTPRTIPAGRHSPPLTPTPICRLPWRRVHADHRRAVAARGDTRSSTTYGQLSAATTVDLSCTPLECGPSPAWGLAGYCSSSWCVSTKPVGFEDYSDMLPRWNDGAAGRMARPVSRSFAWRAVPSGMAVGFDNEAGVSSGGCQHKAARTIPIHLSSPSALLVAPVSLLNGRAALWCWWGLSSLRVAG